MVTVSKRDEDYFAESPSHPGTILKDQFLDPMDMTQTELSDRLNVSFQRVNELVNGKRSFTPETAILLEKLFGVSAGFWLDLQRKYDLYQAYHGPAAEKADNIEAVG